MKTQGEHRGVEAADDEWPDEVDEFYVGARALTQEEAMSGQYTIRDIVLPTPGFAVIYPDNSIGDYYSEFMGRKENGGLDPYNMRRKVSALSLSGSYRKLIGGFIGSPTAKVRVYFDDNEQMHPTDLDIIKMEKSGEWSAAEQAAAAVWANLAQKADEEDRNITGQKRSREVAEDQTDGSKATASDTWLQTAADTDTKRVKVGEKKTNYRPPYVEDGSSASPGTIWDKDEPVSDATTLPQAAVVNKASATDVGEAAATTVSQAPSTVVNQDSLTPDPCASNRANQPSADEGPKLAVILSFKLHVSQYATVALRELMGTSP